MNEVRNNQITEIRNSNQLNELLFLYILYCNFMALLMIYLMYIYYYRIQMVYYHLPVIFFWACITTILNIIHYPLYLSYL
jgi:hypothetical protein